MVKILTEAALGALREFLKNSISHALVTWDGEAHRAEIRSRAILADGRVELGILLGTEKTIAIAITEIALVGADGEIWAARPETIELEGAGEGLLYRFRLRVREEEET